MRKVILFLLFSLPLMAQNQNRATFIYEGVRLDESPIPNEAINEVPVFICYEKVIIASKSNPRIYVLDDYDVTELKFEDGMTYQLIKAKKFILTSEKNKFGNRTYRLQIILETGEANYEVVEQVINQKKD